ncbi:MAG TPA: preprotein translocase subunit YajC [Candidatus Tenderia electrophaga]|uniref:Sec translocon accessory complex subunit YajC n=1 Tax=Candidatus Tenderia electrophaga TaxID=1748243 RepID=A0A832J9Z3_9GAMM|nr:preprotein translocase subunit YajC [Candidatus Tenderia electrophaga]
MSFFISDAIAQEAAAAGGEPGMANFVFLIVLFLIFYFLLLRPQIKRAKEHKKMTEALSKNDEVVTTGGIAGKITKVDESFAMVKIAEGVEVQVQRSSIGSILPKGSVKF